MPNPSTYTEALGDEVVDGLWAGKTIRAICAENPLLKRQTITCWRKQYPEFGARYDEAMKGGAWELVEETREIVDNLNECPHSRKLRSWQRLEEAKRKNHALGDRQIIAGDPEAPLQNVTEQQLDDRITELLAKAEEAK